MQGVQQYKPIEGVNVDTDEKHLKDTESRYLLNVETAGLSGNSGLETPLVSNNAIPYTPPAGVNTTIGRHYSKKTKELYVMVHNSSANHHIYRVNADRTTTLVLQDSLLGFVLDTKNQICYRSHLFYNDNNFTISGNKQEFKYYVWTDGNSWQGFLDVETSIATKGFRFKYLVDPLPGRPPIEVPSTYFSTPDRKIFWQLPTRPSLKCIDLSFVSLSGDILKNNNIIYNTWQFRIKYIYTDGRETSWGPISDSIFHQKSVCASESSYERSIKLIIDAGNPLVEKIVLAYRNCSGNFTADQNPDWFICDYIDKYDKCLNSNTPFYERSLRSDLTYDSASNTFEYVYSGDKLSIPVDRQETDRNYNDIPITSYGLFPLDERLGLANNTYSNNPIDCAELDKISFTVVNNPMRFCPVQTVTVKVGIIIHSPGENFNEPIFIYEEDTTPLAQEKHKAFWGGLRAGRPTHDAANFKQYFEEVGGGNFIAYVEGTQFYAKSRQYFVPNNGAAMYQEVVTNFKEEGVTDATRDKIKNQGYYFSVAEIKVPLGTKGFIRLASHLATVTADYANTSTNVMGIIGNRAGYSSMAIPGHDPLKKEIYFEACTGDVDLLNTPFYVADLFPPFFLDITFQEGGPAMCGYLRAEEVVNGQVVSSVPVERAEIVPNYPAYQINSMITDHNGFYFAVYGFGFKADHDFYYGIDFYIEDGCSKVKGGEAKFHHLPSRHYTLDEQNVSITTPAAYFNTNFINVKILIQDTNNLPISGIWVAAEGAKAELTGADGYASFVLRNRMVNYQGGLTLRFAPVQNGLCPLSTGNCVVCVPEIDISMPICFSGQTITYDNFPKFNPYLSDKGLHPSGTYPLAVKFIDDAGRESDAEGDWKIDIPGIVALQSLAFSTIRYTIASPLALPSWIAKMAILIGKNRNEEDFLSWVVDDLSFTDGAGAIVSGVSADKVKLSIKSLYETERKLNNINVKYQFKRGDRVRFLVNGDGNIFPTNVDLYIESDDNNRNSWEAQTPDKPLDLYNYIIVSYTKELAALKIGAQIEIYSPRKNENQDYYYETCQLIDLRSPITYPLVGTLNAYDTYLMRRQITYNKKANFFAYPFLHHSPSDFWGDHCLSRGRVSVKNPYQKRVKLGRNIAMSLPLFVNGNANGLSTFITQNQKNFTGEQRGDIVCVISIEQYLMFILEHDNFTSSVGDDFVKVDNQNRLRANAGDLTVSDANSKIVGNYGLRYEDIATVVVSDGWVFWWDMLNKAPVLHDFQIARNAAKGKMESYFNNKAKNPSVNIVAGLDPAKGRVHLTFIKDASSFVHSRHQVSYSNNETVSIDINQERGSFIFSFSSFTPENYGYHLQLNGEQALVSFKNGVAYDHSRFNGNAVFNTFFGISVDQVLEFVLNQNPDKVKIPLVMQVQSNVSYWAEVVTTSQGQQSIIVPARSKKITERKYDMEFVCDSLSAGGLYKGTPLRGYTIRVRLVRDNTIGVQVNTIDANKQKAYNELDSILVKYSASEQSGHKK